MKQEIISFEDIEQYKLMSTKNKKFCTTLNYIEHLLTLASTITGFQFMLLLLCLAFL